jgi:hypothetical protein
MVFRNKSKYFPQVHHLKSYVDQNGGFLFVAVVERLHPLNLASWKNVNEEGKQFTSWLATYANRPEDISIKHFHYKKMGKFGA